MKLGIAILLAFFIAFMGYHVAAFWREGAAAEARLRVVGEEHKEAEQEKKNLEADLRFYSDEYNLEKELRSRFNYRGPEEIMGIIVPAQSSSQSSTQ